MKVLVINAGSSSLKYQLFDMENESVLAKGLAERIGIEGSKLTHQPAGRDKVEFVRDMPTHTEAIEMVLDALVDQRLRRDLFDEGDRRGRSPRAARGREVLRAYARQRRRHRSHQRVLPARSAS